MTRRRLLAVAVLVAASMTFGSLAYAVDKCKVKVDNKTGVIRVTATGVAGPLLWGSESGQANTPFFNDATCIAADRAKKCELANPATLAAKTPPDACTVYVDDGVAECSTWIRGCTPRSKPEITGYEVVNSELVFLSNVYWASVDCPPGKKAIGGGGSQHTFGYFLDDSRPKSDGSGWEVQYAPDISLPNPQGIGEAWAICADVAD